MPETNSNAPARRLLRRREAAAMAAWSLPTLSRRERADPTIPARVSTGPNGGPPFGYWSDQWSRYLRSLPTARAGQADPDRSRVNAERARKAAARRTKGVFRVDIADQRGAESRGVTETTRQNTPSAAPSAAPSAGRQR